MEKHISTSKIVFDEYCNEVVAVETYNRFRRQMDMMVSLISEKFLSTVLNKQKLIHWFSEFLKQARINFGEAEEDANTLIITAISLYN